MDTWRYEPLDVKRFPLGTGPFRARGLAYVTALKYVDTRLRGGRGAFLEALGEDDPFAPYYDQIFVMGSDYDVSPLVRLYVVGARLHGVAIGRFIEQRARWSAKAAVQGIWKPLLHTSSTTEMAERSHLAFNRYFQPCLATPISVRPGRFEGELTKLPAVMTGLYVSATDGFFAAAVEMAGAERVRIEWSRPLPDGELSGVSLEKLRFIATWNDSASSQSR